MGFDKALDSTDDFSRFSEILISIALPGDFFVQFAKLIVHHIELLKAINI